MARHPRAQYQTSQATDLDVLHSHLAGRRGGGTVSPALTIMSAQLKLLCSPRARPSAPQLRIRSFPSSVSQGSTEGHGWADWGRGRAALGTARWWAGSGLGPRDSGAAGNSDLARKETLNQGYHLIGWASHFISVTFVFLSLV